MQGFNVTFGDLHEHDLSVKKWTYFGRFFDNIIQYFKGENALVYFF